MKSSYFLKFKYFLITFPVDVFVVLFSIFPFFLLNLSRLSPSRRRRTEFFLLLLAGAWRGYSIVWLGMSLNLPLTHPTYLRVMSSAINLPIWFLALYLILDTRKGYQQKFQERFTLLISTYMSEMPDLSAAAISPQTIERELRQTLEPLRQTLEEISGKELSPKELAKESEFIAAFIHDQVRPLSHKLWRQASIKPPKIGLGRLIQLSLLELELPFAWVAVPAFIYQMISASTIFGFHQAFLRSGLSFLILLAIFGLYKYLHSKQIFSGALINTVVLIICCVAPNLLIRTFFYPLVHPRSSAQLELINFAWYITVLMATSIAFGFYRFQERILAAFDAHNPTLVQSIEDQSYARYIHTDIQSGLLASSIELSRAAENKDVTLGRDAIERAAEILRRDHRRYAVGKAVDPQTRLSELIHAWNGIASIEIVNSDSILQSPPTVVLVAEILEELVANSVRHGQAQSISISIERVGEKVSVTYFDDGLLNTSKRRGVGSEILDLKALSWSRQSDGGANQVRFETLYLH